MEYHGRRNRRGRPRTRMANPPMPLHILQRPPACSAFSGFFNFLILSSLVAIIYLILEYHCNICSKKCDLLNISKSIEDIACNISSLNHSYNDLEKTVMKFSQEIPKMAGQIEILEALANSMEKGDFGWNPKTHLALPNVDVFLSRPESVVAKELVMNISKKLEKHIPKD